MKIVLYFLPIILILLIVGYTYIHNRNYYRYQKKMIDKDYADFKSMSDKALAQEFLRLDENAPRFRRICHYMAVRFTDRVLSKGEP